MRYLPIVFAICFSTPINAGRTKQQRVQSYLYRMASTAPIIMLRVHIESGMLEGNVDKPLDNQGNTAAHVAALHNRPELISLLLEHHCNVSLRNGEGRTALDIAFKLDHTKIVDMLRAAGAGPPSTPRDSACVHEQLEWREKHKKK